MVNNCRVSNEKLIEEAAKAIQVETWEPSCRGAAEAAFRVFEKAHTPTETNGYQSVGTPHTPTDFRRSVVPEPSGYRATLIREAREHADHYRRFDDTESLVSTLVEIANALASEPQGEPSDADLLAALYAYEAKAREQDNFPAMAAPRDLTWFSGASVERMRAALRAANEVR